MQQIFISCITTHNMYTVNTVCTSLIYVNQLKDEKNDGDPLVSRSRLLNLHPLHEIVRSYCTSCPLEFCPVESPVHKAPVSKTKVNTHQWRRNHSSLNHINRSARRGGTQGIRGELQAGGVMIRSRLHQRSEQNVFGRSCIGVRCGVLSHFLLTRCMLVVSTSCTALVQN